MAAKASGMKMGVALSASHISDANYLLTAAREFNSMTMENECKTNSIAKTLTNFNYTVCDLINDWAVAQEMVVRGHVLLWANIG